MNSKDFFELVRRMRIKQRDYFKNRRKADLNESKRLESLVDTEISRVERLLGLPDAVPPQPSIFDTPEQKTP